MNNWKVKAVIITVLLNIILIGASIGMGKVLLDTKNELSAANVVISAKVSEIQEFDNKLGMASTDLFLQKSLTEKYEDEINSFKDDIALKTKKIRKKDLNIKSYERTIALLKNKASGGSTSVIVDNTVIDGSVGEVCNNRTIGYRWTDLAKRFSLFDPDISKAGDEEFTYKQFFRITGLVLTDSSGNVQVKQVKGEELIREGEEGNYTYKPVTGGEFTLIKSKFDYVNEAIPEKVWSWLDPITLRPLAGFDTSFSPTLALELANLGRWIPYADIGIAPKISFNISGLHEGNFSSLQSSRIGLALIYNFIPPLVDTNLGIGVAFMTPFDDLGKWMLTLDVVFYLTQDLSIF